MTRNMAEGDVRARRWYYAVGWSAAAGLLASVLSAALPQGSPAVLLGSARVSVAGTSTMDDYTATTTSARVTRAEVIPLRAWEDIIKPGSVTAFEIAVPAVTLKSGRDGLVGVRAFPALGKIR